MTIPLTGAGGFFVRIGDMAGGFYDINALAGGPATTNVLSGANIATRVVSTIIPDYAAGTPIPQAIPTTAAAIQAFQSAVQALPQTFQTYAQNTLQVMYGIDVLGIPSNAPLSNFQQTTVLTALQGLIGQMTANAASLQQATVTAGSQTAVGTPTGNPIIVTSLKNGMGYTLQLPFPETLTFTCSSDAQTGNAQPGQEVFTIKGQPAVQAGSLNCLYPGGSGISLPITNVAGSANPSFGGTLIINGDFTTYTSNPNYPQNWIIATGLAGTTILNSGSGQAYTVGGGSIEMVSDGVTQIAIQQQFNTPNSTTPGSGGTTFTISPNQVYHFCAFMKVSSVPGAGAMQFALVDGTGAVIQDNQGGSNAVSVTMSSGSSTSYAAVTGSFVTPSVLPTTGIFFRIKQTTAVTSTHNVFFGRVSFAQASGTSGNGVYAGGPFITMHSGNIPSVNGVMPDTWTQAINNSYQTSGTGLMQSLMDRWFNLRTITTPALQFPYSGSPTVSDSLITS